ncbi:MAG: ComF family protein [Hyphomicrobium sp.]
MLRGDWPGAPEAHCKRFPVENFWRPCARHTELLDAALAGNPSMFYSAEMSLANAPITIDDDDDGDAKPRQRRSLRDGVDTIRAAGRAALDLILPPLCLGCEARIVEHNALCPQCWRGIDFVRQPLCDRLGVPLPYGTGDLMISAAAAAHPPTYDRARAVARFDGLMRDLVHDLKFRDTHDGRRLFGRWLAEAGQDLIATADVIAPIPLARFRLLSRRFNQAQILAAEVGRRTGKPVDPMLLTRMRATRRQIGLSRDARLRNVAGAFSVSDGAATRIAGAAILLIDDVITTGATAGAAAATLKRAGASRVDVLALAIVTDPQG